MYSKIPLADNNAADNVDRNSVQPTLVMKNGGNKNRFFYCFLSASAKLNLNQP